MKIKKVEQLNEGVNEELEVIKKLLMEVYEEGADGVEYDEVHGYHSKSFSDWWHNNEEKILSKYQILGNSPVINNNIREVLPGMVRLSNNSPITRDTARRISKYLTPAEFREFKRWLQLIKN